MTSMADTRRMTMAQALVEFLAQQHTSLDGVEQPFFGGMFAIFGHGNVAGMGEALQHVREALPTFRAHNEQAMAHAAIAFAKASRRRRMMACTTSIGPGATNMVTAAAVAHVHARAKLSAIRPGGHLDRAHPVADGRPRELGPVQRRGRHRPLLALPGHDAQPTPVDPHHARGVAAGRQLRGASGGPAPG